MPTEKTRDFEKVFRELFKFGIYRQIHLAEALGVKPSTVSDAKKRGTFPRKWAEILSKKYNTKFEDIITPVSNKDQDVKDMVIQLQAEYGKHVAFLNVTIHTQNDEIKSLNQRLQLIEARLENVIRINPLQKKTFIPA